VRLTVTPLGATGRSAAGVAAAVVDYLEGNEGDRGTALVVLESNGLTGAGRYYADSIEGPGSWLGSGAEFRGLSGVVDRESFRSVLEGRHPMTGERLVTARGSSQRSHLAVGTVARFDGQGRPLYTLADAASLLGKSRSEVDELVAAGQSAAGAGATLTEGFAVVLDPVLGPLVPDGEVARLLEAASSPIDAAAVRLTGSADDELSVSQAARLLGVSARYVRRLCAAGEKPESNRSRPSLSSGRDRSGDYRIRRADLADFAGRRKPPVARVGFDLTLTVEKSIGLIAMLSDGPRQQRIVDALSTANEVAIAYLDRHASVTRRRGETVASEGLLAASYMHATSRALDPHPHFHNVIANAVVDDEGGVRAVDARALYCNAPAAAALAPPQHAGSCETSASAGGDDPRESGRSPESTEQRFESSPSVATRWTRYARHLRSDSDEPSPTTRRTPSRSRRVRTRSPATRPHSARRGRTVPIESASQSIRALTVPTGRWRSMFSPTTCSSGCSATSSTRRTACVHVPTRSERAMS